MRGFVNNIASLNTTQTAFTSTNAVGYLEDENDHHEAQPERSRSTDVPGSIRPLRGATLATPRQTRNPAIVQREYNATCRRWE